MRQRSRTVIGLGVGVVLFFAVNVLANASLRSVRIDLTEEKLFTLTAGSKNIARAIEEPIRVKLFVSRKPIDEVPPFKAYAQRVEEMLVEYELASDGKLELDVVDPEPFSEAEEAAVEAGLSAAPLGAGLDKLYFGLVATNAVGDRETIAFFDPGQERFLEYEVSRLIYTLDHPEKKVVGILTSLPMDGGGFNPMTRQPQSPRWRILDYVDSLFETRTLEAGLTEIPDDVDVLWIAHPKALSDATRFAIDQFVLKGGKTIALIDPWCEADTSGDDPTNPYAGMSAERGSTLPGLLEAWGVELVPNRIAGDRTSALQVVTNAAGGQERWPMVVWLGLQSDAFDADDAVTSRLSSVNVATPGILRPKAGATTALQPLIRTSTDSMDVDVGSVRFMPDPKELFSSFIPTLERYTIAARVTGSAQSAFETPPPKDEAAPEDPAAEGTDGEGDDAAETLEHVKEGSIHVIVIADADFLDERFWLQDLGFFGYRKTADNGDLLINALENLAGSDDLIAIRGRGEFARPFHTVQAIERDAKERYLSEDKLLEQTISATEGRINELLQKQDPGALILTPEVEAEIENLRADLVDANKRRRDVQYNMRKDIERLGTRLKWINIGALPLIVAVFPVLLGFLRTKKRKHA